MLAAFAAVNTVMYGVLAIGKLLPKVYVADWLAPRNQRSESRSIYPTPDATTNPTPSSRGYLTGRPSDSTDDESPELLDPVP